MKELIKAALGGGDTLAGRHSQPVADGALEANGAFERRVMLALAREENARLQRRVRITMIAAAACFVGFMASLPLAEIVSTASRAFQSVGSSLSV